ncbi:MAG: energy transducer TonB [Syntrophales bacterium]|nr:energy transducer TonB [Syntrophales bacterium]
MERVTFEKDLFFAVIIALAIHAGAAFTHIYTVPRPVHFKAKKYSRLIISMVSTHAPDVVPVVQKKRKVVVKEKKEIIKPDNQSTPIPKREIVKETVSLKKAANKPVSTSVPMETAKEVLAVPRYGENMPPAYPAIARRRGYEGIVILSAEILVNGNVGKLKIKKSSGYSMLDRSALETVRKWKFEPGSRMGCPVTMYVEVPVRFVLNDK